MCIRDRKTRYYECEENATNLSLTSVVSRMILSVLQRLCVDAIYKTCEIHLPDALKTIVAQDVQCNTLKCISTQILVHKSGTKLGS